MRFAILLAGGAFLVAASASSAQPGPAMGGGRGQGAMMSKIDLNSDGFVTAAEHRQWTEKVFATMDSNKDGKLRREEYLAVHMGPGPGGGQDQARMQAMRQQANARKVQQFSAMDTDKNESATRAEFLAHAEQNFAAKDTEKDGKISIGEFRSWHHPW